MTRRHVALALPLAALLLAVALPASAQRDREEPSLTDLVRLLQSEDATEDQLAAVLSAAENLLGDPPPCDPENPMFDDVPADSLFCPFIEELARRGITGGCGGGNFCPGDAVTRAQMAAFIVSAQTGAPRLVTEVTVFTPALNAGECAFAFAEVPDLLFDEGVLAHTAGTQWDDRLIIAGVEAVGAGDLAMRICNWSKSNLGEASGTVTLLRY